VEVPALRIRARAGREDVSGGAAGNSAVAVGKAEGVAAGLAAGCAVRLRLPSESRVHERRMSEGGADHV
jgi:hypothetical protein